MPKPKRVSMFQVFRRELGPFLGSLGLREVLDTGDNSTLEYKRTDNPDNIVGLWFQRDAKAFNVEQYGTRFIVEFARSFELKDRRRIGQLLSAEQLEVLREIQNRVIRRLPTTHVKTDDEPYKLLHDRWMRYRDEEDLLAWAAYLRETLPAVLAKFEAEFPPVPEQ